MREALYDRRYGHKVSDEDRLILQSTHVMYRETLKKLYVQILKFEAGSICYFSKNGGSRLALDMIKWDNWDLALSEIRTREDAFCNVYEIWKDQRDQEEQEALFMRHKENLDVMKSISGNVSGLRTAIELAQRNKERSRLLDWLSDIDPSENFNAAWDKHEALTGNWLLRDKKDFQRWKTIPGSFMWLNGKGKFAHRSNCAILLMISSWLWKVSPQVRFQFSSLFRRSVC